MKTTKKHCHSAACDVKAKHLATETNDGQPVWECQNCGQLTARRVVARKRNELDDLYDELTRLFEIDPEQAQERMDAELASWGK
jgi:hypothetical protein